MFKILQPYEEADLSVIHIDQWAFCLPLPIHGSCPLTIPHNPISLDDNFHIKPCDDKGNRYSEILHQDWHFRYAQKEALAGSLFLSITIHIHPAHPDLSTLENIGNLIINEFEEAENRAYNAKVENAKWLDEPIDCTPTYQFPTTLQDFKQKDVGGHTFLSSPIGGTSQETLPIFYYLPIRKDAYICFKIAPSGFIQEHFDSTISRQNYLENLADEFMGNIQIEKHCQVAAAEKNEPCNYHSKEVI